MLSVYIRDVLSLCIRGELSVCIWGVLSVFIRGTLSVCIRGIVSVYIRGTLCISDMLSLYKGCAGSLCVLFSPMMGKA